MPSLRMPVRRYPMKNRKPDGLDLVVWLLVAALIAVAIIITVFA